MSAGPLVRLPSGKVCGAEIVAGDRVVPHQFGCQCERCEPGNAADEKMHTALHAVANLLLALTYNRFGKPETYNARDEREAIRLLAIEYDVGPSQTVLEQAGKVARAAALASGGEQ